MLPAPAGGVLLTYLTSNNIRKELVMNNILKLMGILLVLSLLTLPLIGCDPPWESGMVLNLKINTPKEGTTVTTPTITVSGRVTGTDSKDAKVTINKAEVTVKDRKYSTDVTLTEGKNLITIIASNGQATLTEQRTITYNRAK
jgi:hypothetical protein